MDTRLAATLVDEPAPVSDAGAARVRAAVAALARGEMVALSDGRETALVLAGSRIGGPALARMIYAGSGMVFAATSRNRLREMRIPQMAGDRTDHPYHVAIDAAEGIGTGISALDRARAIRLLATPGTTAAEFRRPGHVIPVAADLSPRRYPGLAELALALVELTGDPVPVAAYSALVSETAPSAVAGPAEGAAMAAGRRLAFVRREDVLAAIYRGA